MGILVTSEPVRRVAKKRLAEAHKSDKKAEAEAGSK